MASITQLRNTNLVVPATCPSGSLKPGYGLSRLHIGMTREQCRAAFGDPDEVRSFRDGTFFQYFRAGFDLDFELGSRAVRIFFYRKGSQKHVGQCDVSANGVRFGAHLQDITAAWGGPDRHGSVGKRRWMMYNKGVQFDLDTRGRIEVIIVFNPE